jgi:hypothetical protein
MWCTTRRTRRKDGKISNEISAILSPPDHAKNEPDFLLFRRQLTPTLKRESLMFRFLIIGFLINMTTGIDPATGQAPTSSGRAARPTPPTRDPHTPGYVAATESLDGANAPASAADRRRWIVRRLTNAKKLDASGVGSTLAGNDIL